MQAISVAVLLIIGAVNAAPKAERVQALPLCGPLPSAWYSGYLPVSTTKSLHYMYVESLGNTTTDPLVIWLNGGPGCSSLLGAFSENGPFIFDDGQTLIKPNEFSWNTRANVLYIESPAQVGFSIGGPNDWYFTDMSQSIDLFAALQQFYVKFPELLPNGLWISGESYAGVYGPYLAWQIHNWNQAQFEGGLTYNLKGFAIGNGITDWNVDAAPATFETYREFNLIPPEIYSQFAKNNCTYNVARNPKNVAQCTVLENQVDKLIQGFNPYDLFRTVYGNSGQAKQQTKGPEYGEVLIGNETKRYKRSISLEKYAPWVKHSPFLKTAAKEVSFGDPMTDYLNRADVRAALNIPQSVQAWEGCSTNAKFDYPFSVEASIWIYTILQKYSQYTMMHYSGDTDGIVPTLGTRRWVDSLGWPITKDWEPWTTDDQYSGSFIQYAENFYLLTVHGVGHMAPQWKKKDMQRMILKYFHGENFSKN